MSAVKRTSSARYHLGFIGNGEVTAENAEEQLDLFLPENADDYLAYVPRIKRGQRGLSAVHTALASLGMEPDTLDTGSHVIDALDAAKAGDNDKVFLVVLWDEAEDTMNMVETAISKGIPVKDLTQGMDDIELAPEEPEPAPAKTRGKPRATTNEKAVQATVEGPATLAPTVTGLPSSTCAEQLEAAIRSMIREELTIMGRGIGHNVYTTMSEQDEKVRDSVRAFVSDDGEYELAGDRKRAPRGKKAVELTPEEAAAAGLTGS